MYAISVAPNSRQASSTPFVLGISVQQRVLHLVGRQRNASVAQRGVRHSHLLGGVVADPDGADFARLYGVGHQVHQGWDGHPARGKWTWYRSTRDRRSRVRLASRVAGRLPAREKMPSGKLRRHQDVLALGQLTHPPLRGPLAVHGGGVEKIHPGGEADLQRLPLIFDAARRSVGVASRTPPRRRHVAPDHHAQPQPGHPQTRPSQRHGGVIILIGHGTTLPTTADL